MSSTYDTLAEGINEGLGTGYDYRDPRLDTISRLKTNLVTFTAFKNYNMQAEMISALTDKNGKIRSFSQFKKEVTKLNEKYNKNWLRTEYNTAKAASQTAAQWEDFLRSARIFPYLIYKSQDDSHVRNSHQALHNVAKKIDDPFWDTYYPPNGWNCRCYVLQSKTADGYNDEPISYPDDKQQPPAFRHNAGKEKKLWTQEHPYFHSIPKKTKDKIWKARNKFYSSDKFYDVVEGIEVHVSAYKSDSLVTEMEFAKKMKSLGQWKNIRKLPEEEGSKSIDFIVDGVHVEYKRNVTATIKTIEKKYSLARKQMAGVTGKRAIYIEIGNQNIPRLTGKLLKNHEWDGDLYLVKGTDVMKIK